MLTRRLMLAGSAFIALPAWGADNPLAALEAKSGGRLGVAARDTGSNRSLAWRAGERFAMCSTFKLLLAAAVQARIQAGAEQGDRVIHYATSDLLSHSPVTERLVSVGATVQTLCAAVVRDSDNTGANLLLQTLGGPAGWTAFVRSIGDDVSRLDRTELALNTAIPGDPRDTTTPAAMLEDLGKVLLGGVLPLNAREFLTDSMAASTTGLKRLRAGLPKGWRAADKTGTGGNGTYNDIGILTPPGRPPILAAVYLTGSKLSDDDSNALIAEVGRMIAAA